MTHDEERRRLEQALERCGPAAREVIERRLGLAGHAPAGQEQVAEAMGLELGEVRRLEAKVVSRARHPTAA